MDNFEAYKELRKMLASYDDMARLDAWTYRKYETAIEKLLEAQNKPDQEWSFDTTSKSAPGAHVELYNGKMYAGGKEVSMRAEDVQ